MAFCPTQRFQSHRHQGYGLLFAGTQQHIHLPFGGIGIQFQCIGHKLIGLFAASGGDHHHLMAFIVGLEGPASRTADLLRIRNRCSAKFLHYNCHF
jgi:hypothetical protein